MDVYLLRKQKNRIYKSEDVFAAFAAGADLTGLELRHAENGAPFIVFAGGDGGDEAKAAPWISLSDTKNFQALVLSEAGPVGVDIEEPRKVKTGTARMLHKLEGDYLSALEAASPEWTREFLRIWTAKESYMKYCGEGLALGLGSFSVISEELGFAPSVVAGDMPPGYLSYFEHGRLIGCVCSSFPGIKADIRELAYAGKPSETAEEKAFKLLAAREHCEFEIRAKLRRCGYSEEELDAAISAAKDYGYIDDARYAGLFVNKSAKAGKAEARIRYELAEKGISGSIADSALEELRKSCDEDDEARAVRIARGMPCSSEKELARIGRRLNTLGYSPYIIYRIKDELRSLEG